MLFTSHSFETYSVAYSEKRWEERRTCIAMYKPNYMICIDRITLSKYMWLHLCICRLNGSGPKNNSCLVSIRFHCPLTTKTNKQTKKNYILIFVPFHFLFLNYHFQEFLILLLIQEHASKALFIMTIAFLKSSSPSKGRNTYLFTL